jgi:hypothetical protein
MRMYPADPTRPTSTRHRVPVACVGAHRAERPLLDLRD